MNLKKLNGIQIKKLFAIGSLIMVCIFDVLCIACLIMLKDYYGLMLSTAILVIICVAFIVSIINLVAIVGFIYKDFKLNSINLSISSFLCVVISVACFYLFSINTSVNNIIDNKGLDQYEIISISLASYKNEYKDISDCNGKKVGVVTENEIGITSVFKDEATNKGISPKYSEYNTTNDLFFALVTNEIDIAVFPGNYRMLYEKDDEVDYSHYLNDVHNFYSIEKKVKTGVNELANADLTLEPFNILLIGFAPEEGSNGKYGLSDTIIVATVNPNTMEVGLTSIARDSYVPIACYSGYKDKINAARGKSRQCLMDTVGNLLGLDINLYMEANFDAVVKIVDAVGGIDINSPVAFVGQTSSEIRGTFTVEIPAGYYHANGEEALAFARERHAMPGGDFDRQEHQKQVIKEVMAKVLETRDIGVVTNIIKTCGENLSTNLSMQQITKLFNYLITIENNTALPMSQVVDMQNARLTGYSSWYYNYSAHLPLWIYKLYDGSIKEAKQHIVDIMNGYDADAKQKENTKFFTYYPYSRPDFFHTVFNEAQDHEEMPAYYKTLEGLSYTEALAWANENGVKLNINMILPGQSGYNESQFGQVISQDVPYGSLVSDYPSVTLTVMGNVSGNYVTLENFVGKGYYYATEWAKSKDIKYSVTFVDNNTPNLSGTVKSQSYPAGTLSVQISELKFEVYKFTPISDDQIVELKAKVGIDAVKAWGTTYGYGVVVNEETTDQESENGKVKDVQVNNNETTGNSVTVFIYKYEASVPVTPTTYSVTVTCGSGGTVSGGGDYADGTSVTVTATPASGYHFVSWSDGGDQEHTVTISGNNISINAIFEPDTSPSPAP